MAHLLPVMLREPADHKHAGPSCRRRSCSLRIIEPKSDALPGWFDLDVPDDRFIAPTRPLIAWERRDVVMTNWRDGSFNFRAAWRRVPRLLVGERGGAPCGASPRSGACSTSRAGPVDTVDRPHVVGL
ncbi:hypothetical protein [Streptomyces sp. NPDC127066]|uniref:hypothetical protein n=1 Tax=Streptomyces sp. NPDC127066 TaxID=3347125 RepID=UPI0036625B34